MLGQEQVERDRRSNLLQIPRETPQHRFLSAEDRQSGSQAGSGKVLHEFLHLVIENAAARYHYMQRRH